MLATFVGFQVIQNVSRLLHTPLMSLTNAISAIAVVGSIIIAGEQKTTFAHRARHDRGRRLDDQHRERLPDHRPHAQDVQGAGAALDDRASSTQLGYLVAATPLRLLAALAQRARRRRGAACWPASPAWASPCSARCCTRRSSNFTWIAIALVVGTAIGIPLSRVPLTAVPQRTALSHAFGGLAAGLVGTAKYSLWLDDGRAHRVPHRRDRGRGDPRLPDLHRQPDGGRQAPGGDPDPADHLPRPELREPRAARDRGRCRRRGWSSDPTRWPLFPSIVGLSLLVRRAADHPDRRRRHADRDLAPELLRGPRRGGDGLRAREQAADHRGRARRLLGPHPLDHHVPRHEPLLHERAVRRLRPGAGRGSRRRGSAGQERHAAGRRRLMLEQRAAAWWSCRATAWRWRRRSTACASSTTSSAKRGIDVQVRDPPGRRPHARPHERAARRGRHPLRRAGRDGRHQPRACRRPTWCSWSAPTTS